MRVSICKISSLLITVFLVTVLFFCMSEGWKTSNLELIAHPKKSTVGEASGGEALASSDADSSSYSQEIGGQLGEGQDLEELQQLLPTWLIEHGELFEDRREISGQTVLRSRARYQWESGENLEIEVTDIGSSANEDVNKALGFNPELADTESDSGYTMTQVDQLFLLNEEYDHNDQAGSLQLLIEDRYLIEIQLESLPQETFQRILDRDLPFERIFRRADS